MSSADDSKITVDLDELKAAPLISELEAASGLKANVAPAVYRLKNASSGLFFDNSASLATENNPIITWPENGTDAQLWSVYRVGDAGLMQNYAMQNASSGMFARASSYDIGAGLVISQTFDTFQFIADLGNPTLFRIKPTNEANLAIQGAGKDEQVTLRTVSKTQLEQLWRLVREA